MLSQDLRLLLTATQMLLRSKAEKERLRGESFNIFSVLGLERNENRTHSAMLCELLNPQGSHLMKDIFLRLFLDRIGATYFITKDAVVTTEFHIGSKDLDGATGGRIDILLKDGNGNHICIENKIYAGDQEQQIVRYCNFEKAGNTVYYLTLFGDEPSAQSKGKLETGKDFHCLSYRDDIIPWLRHCMKEAAEWPILRESLRQYIILLQKLTHTMNKMEEQQLLSVLLENYMAAEFVATNFEKARVGLWSQLYELVFTGLENHLKDSFVLKRSLQATTTHTRIWIQDAAYPDAPVFFGLQQFNAFQQELNGDMFVGIYFVGANDHHSSPYKPDNSKLSIGNWWPDVRRIAHFKQEFSVNMGDAGLIRLLSLNPKSVENLADHIVVETVNYIREQQNGVGDFLKHQSTTIEH